MGGSLAAVTPPGNVAGGASTTYNADNEQSNFNGVSLTYDANGNLTGDGSNTYTWDARNHLTSINSGTTASFVYDAFGRRMKKTVSGTTTQFLYDGLNPVQELSGRGAVVANLLTGLRIDEYFTRTDSSNNVSAFLADALGSTVGLVNSLGAIATNYTYEPFGATTVGGSANGNSYEFTGRENDGTGLYFYRARYYSPTFHRFIAQDPLGFAGGDTNLYGYVYNAPTDLTDPTGQQAEMICEEAPQLCEEAGEGLSALINAVGAAVAGAADLLCHNDRKQKCEEQYNNDIAICRTLPDRGGAVSLLRFGDKSKRPMRTGLGSAAAANNLVGQMGIFLEVSGTIEDANGSRPFELQIFDACVDPNTPYKDFASRIHCPALLDRDFDVYGVSQQQAQELALKYVRIRTEGATIRDHQGQVVKL